LPSKEKQPSPENELTNEIRNIPRARQDTIDLHWRLLSNLHLSSRGKETPKHLPEAPVDKAQPQQRQPQRVTGGE
jgi:hypothetical protein